jgi:hypothetical protein
LCLNCHGGTYTFPATPVDVNQNSNFRELDLSTYKFPGLRITPNGTEQAAFKKQNQFIRSTLAARQPILDLIDGWYAPGRDGFDTERCLHSYELEGKPATGALPQRCQGFMPHLPHCI